MKIFDFEAPKPDYVTKHGKTHCAVGAVLCLIVNPIISILMFATGGINLVSTSISKIGWQQGLLPLVYVWGLLNIALFVYLLKLALDYGGYSKNFKILLYSLTGISCLFLLVGISIPFINDDVYRHFVMRKVHNVFATIGFVMFVVVLLTMTAATFGRSKTQGFISCALAGFLIITGVFAVLCVNSPEKATFITAAAQLYIFTMLHVLLLAQVFLNKVSEPKPIGKK